MKKIILFSFTAAFVFLAGLYAYKYNNTGISKPTYQPRSSQPTTNFGWKGAQDLYFMLRRNANTGTLTIEDIMNARKAVDNSYSAISKTTSLLYWDELGPDNIGGRTRGILVDNTSDGSRVYAGAASGGVFVSYDAGNNWQPLNNTQDNLCISSMTQGPDGTIWVATGSAFENFGLGGTGGSGFVGDGLFKLTPGQNFLTKLLSTSPSGLDSSGDWSIINVVRVDKNNRVYVALNKGLRYSDDGGNTWTNPVIVPETSNPLQSPCVDVEITATNDVIAAFKTGVWYSPNGNVGTFARSTGIPGNNRIEMSIAPTNQNRVYAVACNYTGGYGDFSGFWESTNKGISWTKIPTLASFNPFNITGSNPQGAYNMLLGVDPSNENVVYIGGIDLYKYDGNFTHISQWSAPEFFPYYVHADQHTYAYNPQNSSELYYGNDGGIFKSFTQGNFFFAANRGYNVTQFYTLGFTAEGYVFGGTQDNGTLFIDGKNSVYPKQATQISGGDGFGCDASNITPVIFGSVYNGNVRKGKSTGGGLGDYCSGWNCADGNFYTPLRLWESINDTTSRDSIEYVIEDGSKEYILIEANGTTKKFSGIVPKTLSNVKFLGGSISFRAGTQLLSDTDGDGNLTGDGTGTFNYTTGAYDITFTTNPANKLNVRAYYQGYIDAGEVLQLTSNTPDVALRGNTFTVPYTVPTYSGPGTIIKVKDPVQSLLAFGASTGRVYFTRNSLKDKDPEWFNVRYSLTNQAIKTMEFSPDGNHLFVGTFSGNVFRISGLNKVYDQAAAQLTSGGGEVTSTLIFSAGSRVVTGISLDPKNPNTIAISLGNYGSTNHVYVSNQALTATNSSTFVVAQGDLPPMPVYSILISNDDNKTIVAGTEFGVYTSSIFNTNVWTPANGNLPRVPVFAVRQQLNPWAVTDHTNTIYIGTHGRGIWKNTAFVGIDEGTPYQPKSFISSLQVFPNPAINRSNIQIQMNLSFDSQIKLSVYNIQGALVHSEYKSLSKGNSTIQLDIENYKSGNYFLSIEANNEFKTAKFVISK